MIAERPNCSKLRIRAESWTQLQKAGFLCCDNSVYEAKVADVTPPNEDCSQTFVDAAAELKNSARPLAIRPGYQGRLWGRGHKINMVGTPDRLRKDADRTAQAR